MCSLEGGGPGPRSDLTACDFQRPSNARLIIDLLRLDGYPSSPESPAPCGCIPRILNRDGVRIPDQPPAPELAPADPVASLVRTHRFRGIDPGPGAGLCWPEVRDEAENRFRESLDPS